MVPFGVLDVVGGLLTIIFGTSRETSDFIADCLQQWWDANRERYAHIRQLVIKMPIASVMPTFGNWSSTWTTARRTPASGRNS